MKLSNLFFLLATILLGMKPTSAPSMNNPTLPTELTCSALLAKSQLPLGALPYNEITTDSFQPALESAFRECYQRLDLLREESATPTFTNTIEAIEAIDLPLEQAWLVFENYTSLNADPKLDELSQTFTPERKRLSNAIFMDSHLFSRVSAIYDQRDSLGLNTEQTALLVRTYTEFLRNGAKLSDSEKKRVAEIDERLAFLGEKFRANVTAEVNAYELVLKDPAQVVGVPSNALAAAKALAAKKGYKDSWVFTLQFPSYQPLITFANDRGVRETIWRAFNTKASSGEYDNRMNSLEIAKLNAERAQILGYNTHADFIAEDRMAKNSENVRVFLKRLATAYLPAAKKDIEELREFAGHDLQPWDVAYYSEKLREARYAYSEDALREYFPLDQVMRGALFAAEKRYGIVFVERTDLPKWHEDVLVYEVREPDEKGVAKTLALFYLDPYPRESKRQGAWMSELQRARYEDGKWVIPHVLNAGNFTPPVTNEDGTRTPALLSLDEVYTVFHELGHGLHGMLTRVGYRSLSGANTAWDAVELPSQINENWVIHKDVLPVYAKHYKTGLPLPETEADKVRRAQNFQAGLMGLRQVSFGMLDYAWFGSDLEVLSKLQSADDVTVWEEKIMNPYRVIPVPAGNVMSPSFSHIFGGGYSAGYYSYKWADVLAADAFSVFEKNGVFDSETSMRFRKAILEAGRSLEPDVLYRQFKGGDPDPDALLRKEGLLK